MISYRDPYKWQRVRLRLITCAFLALFLGGAGKAFYLQAVKNATWGKAAANQSQKTVALVPARGTIYDAAGAPLAVSVDMDSLFAEPRNVADPAATARQLAPLLNLPAAELAAKLGSKRGFEWLARRIDHPTAQAIRARKLAGLGFVKETKRFYPNGSIAGHVLGFTGLDPDGLEGVEKRYNAMIIGSTGYVVVEHDGMGRELAGRGLIVKGATQGDNVYLTIDKNLQYIVEKELAKAVAAAKAKGGYAIVMEPATGKLLAMANVPDFDPNHPGRVPPLQRKNRAVVDSLEPGSTFKAFLVAAALDEGAIRAGDQFNCEQGSYAIGGKVVHDTHKYGSLTVADILKYSSNIGAVKIGSKLGAERMHRRLKQFGFAERTGIDLPGEIPGLLRDHKNWYAVDQATIAFGQGVSVTPLQLVAAMGAIANGGNLMQPYVVDRVVDLEGRLVQQNEPVVRRRAVGEAAARKTAAMLERVTTEGGTGTLAAVPGYRVAGKTGTAQKVDPGTHGYSLTKRIGSFLGFAPADRPQLVILVAIDEPTTSPYGGVVAAPAFAAIAQQSLCYLRIPPAAAAALPAPAAGRAGSFTPPPAPSQPPAPPAPVVADPAAQGDGELLDNEAAGPLMPDFTGLTMRQTLRRMEQDRLNVRLIGSGQAVEQSPAPGQPITPAAPIWVRFAPPR